MALWERSLHDKFIFPALLDEAPDDLGNRAGCETLKAVVDVDVAALG